MRLTSLSNEELVLNVDNDPSANERERLLAERLAYTMRYIAEVTVFLHRHDLLEQKEALIQ